MSLKRTRFFGPADAAIVLASAFWGLNIAITNAAAGSDPSQFRLFVYNAIRFPLASALLFMIQKLRGRPLGVPKDMRRSLAALAFVGVFVYQILYMTGQSMSQSATIGVLYGVTPLIILCVSILSGVERPTGFVIAGVLVGCVGIVPIISTGGHLTLDMGSTLFLCALVCWASYTVFSRPMLSRVPPVTATAWILLWGSLYQLPLAFWQLPRQSWTALAPANILFVFVSAVFSLFLGYTLFYFAILTIGPSRTGAYSNLTPVFALIFAVLIRHEHIRASQVIGLTIILAGIALTKVRRKEGRAPGS